MVNDGTIPQPCKNAQIAKDTPPDISSSIVRIAERLWRITIMTCEDCKFYKNECESHAQLESIGLKHDMKTCEIFCPTYVECWECIHFKVCQACGELTGRLTSCPYYQKKVANGRWITEVVRRPDWKGKMRDYYQAASCSVCHKPDPGRGTSNYCPNCGADMRGDGNG